MQVPSLEEWEDLKNYLGEDAAKKIKEPGTKHWKYNEHDVTNETGFTALPSGELYSNLTGFTNYGYDGTWWTSTKYPSYNGAYKAGIAGNSFYVRGNSNYSYGYSIRCVKD